MTLSVDGIAHAAEPHTAFNLPDERIARIAARRAFVELKLCFMRAAADIDGPSGALLQQRVRHTREPVHLWRLCAAVLAGLRERHERTPLHRLELHRRLDSIFADSYFDPSAS